jgi:hypothetical protein
MKVLTLKKLIIQEVFRLCIHSDFTWRYIANLRLRLEYQRIRKPLGRPVLPLNHPVFLGNAEDAGLHRRESSIRLPALKPSVRVTPRSPLGPVRQIAPAAASNEHVQ